MRSLFSKLAIGALLGAMLLAATSAAAAPRVNIKLTAAAKIINITAWSFGQPGPPPWGGKDDVYSVTVRNPWPKSSAQSQVSFLLVSRNHGQPSATTETILWGSNGYFLTAKPPTWVVHLAPGRTTTVFFMTRTVGDDTYCVGNPYYQLATGRFTLCSK